MNPKLVRFILSLFYIGEIKLAPGTLASLITLIFWYFVPNIYYLQLIIILIIGMLSFVLCFYYEKITKIKDPSYIVLDELFGMIIALYMIPKLIPYYLLCFFLFRFFDIFKPSLIYKSQDVGSGIGVVLDDLISGFLTLIIVTSYIYL